MIKTGRFYVKLFMSICTRENWTFIQPRSYRQVLRFINPIVDSMVDDIWTFEPERSFSHVFVTFVNQWYVDRDKNVFKLACRFHAFTKIPEMWKLTHIKLYFQHHCEIKMSLITVFWSNCEIKMLQNTVFRLNREIKMVRKFLALKYTQ